MRKLFLCTFFIVVVIAGHAQIVIQGKVLSNATNLPIANASVYLNNTSFGTVTNDKGEFSFTVNSLYSGEIIVSSVGYERLFYKIENRSLENKRYVFKLEVKENTLDEVLVLSDANRKAWLKLFVENFLGTTQEADECEIKNLDAVYFTIGENKNIIFAYADSPLIIVNKMLGYKIAFDLVEFSFNKLKNATYFVGYNRYEELGDKKRWIKNRKLNYYGSTMHFYRSLLNRDLEKEGFYLSEIVKKKDGPDSAKKENVVIMSKTQGMSVAYPIEGSKILYIDSITNEYALKFSNKIMVQYNKYPHGAYYLSTKTMVRGLNRYGFTAYIEMLADQVGLDENGIVHSPLALVYDGYWVYEKLANQLPFDYKPE